MADAGIPAGGWGQHFNKLRNREKIHRWRNIPGTPFRAATAIAIYWKKIEKFDVFVEVYFPTINRVRSQ